MLEQSGQVRAANILPHDVLIYPLNYLNFNRAVFQELFEDNNLLTDIKKLCATLQSCLNLQHLHKDSEAKLCFS
eukprot:UN07992